MKCSLGISDFLEEISGLSQSAVIRILLKCIMKCQYVLGGEGHTPKCLKP